MAQGKKAGGSPKKQRVKVPSRAKSPPPDRPYKWEEACSAAYLILLGETQQAAATQVGVAIRTVSDWRRSLWWPDAEREAKERWLGGAIAGARRGILEALKDEDEYATMSRWVAERTIGEMKPPKLQQELTGADGGPVQVKTERHQYTDAELLAIIAAEKAKAE